MSGYFANISRLISHAVQKILGNRDIGSFAWQDECQHIAAFVGRIEQGNKRSSKKTRSITVDDGNVDCRYNDRPEILNG